MAAHEQSNVAAPDPGEPAPRGLRALTQGLALLAVLAAAIAVYAPHLDHPFQYDDLVKIVGNAKLRDPSVFLRAFARGGYQDDASRLVPNLTLSLDDRLFGGDPFGYHLTNLVLHLCNVCLVFLFGHAICRRTGMPTSPVPALAAAIFALHPLQSEAVLYNNARPNLLVTPFYLTALIALLGAASGEARSIGARVARWLGFGVATALALLSKELAVTLVVMAPLVLAWSPGSGIDARAAWKRLAPALAVLGALGAAVTLATGAGGAVVDIVFHDGGERAGHWAKYLVFIVLEQAAVFVRYHALALVPWPGLLNADHAGDTPLRRTLLSGAATLGDVGPAILSLAAALAVLYAAFAWRRRAPFATLCVLWPFVTHAPTSLVPRDEVMVEYRTYLPMVGVCLLLAWSCERLLRRPPWRGTDAASPRRVAALGVALATLLATGAATRARAWDSREALWRDSLAKAPRNPRALNNLGLALDDAGKLAEAERLYRRSIAVEPRYVRPYNNLGNLLLRRGDTDDAIAAFETALGIDPDFTEAHSNLGRALVAAGRAGDAIAHHERAVARNPASAAYHTNLASALAAMGRTNEAVAHFRRALALEPDSALGHANLAGTLEAAGRRPDAIEHFQRALALEPGFADAHASLGALLAQEGRFADAMPHLRRAVALAPASADAHNNLASALGRQGSYDEAIEHYRRALELRPGFPEAQEGLAVAIELRAGARPGGAR